MNAKLFLDKLRLFGFEAACVGKSHIIAQDNTKGLFRVYNIKGRKLFEYGLAYSNVSLVQVGEKLKILTLFDDNTDRNVASIVVNDDSYNDVSGYDIMHIWGNWVWQVPNQYAIDNIPESLYNIKTQESIQDILDFESFNWKIINDGLEVVTSKSNYSIEKILGDIKIVKVADYESDNNSIKLIITYHIQEDGTRRVLSHIMHKDNHYIIREQIVSGTYEHDELTEDTMQFLYEKLVKRIKDGESVSSELFRYV